MTLFSAPSRPGARLAGLVLSSGLLFAAAAAIGAGALPQNAAPPQKVALRGGTSWAELTPAQRSALAPLQQEWNTLGPENRAKWLQVAARYPGMSEAERARMQARMEAWSRLSPQERGQARLRYQQAQTVPPQERRERWEQYQALPADQRRQLSAGSAKGEAPRKPEARANGTAPRSFGRDPAQAKSNLVPSTAPAVPPKAVAPTIVQAKPGATTNLMSRPPKPPNHQQTGLPKIAATPGLVDRTTLLPKRSPQGAATPPKASAGEPDKKQ
jgi:hypothetical protein